MCGRFALEDDGTAVQDQFDLAETPQLAARYNIAPTQPVAAVGRKRAADGGGYGLTHFYWGFVPSWAKDISMASRMINARAETVHEKPSFRAAFKRRRCLIPLSGFYEWQKLENGRKQPLYIHPTDAPLFAVAALWENWHSPDGSELRSTTLLTTTPNELMAPIHNRMPVLITPQDYETWLDPETPPAVLQSLLKPFSSEKMAAYPVSSHVNSPRNEGPTCSQPLH